jgi:hypothetical protein
VLASRIWTCRCLVPVQRTVLTPWRAKKKPMLPQVATHHQGQTGRPVIPPSTPSELHRQRPAWSESGLAVRGCEAVPQAGCAESSQERNP